MDVVHELVTPHSLPKLELQRREYHQPDHHPEKVVEKFTNSGRVFWTAVCLLSTVAGAGFYAGGKFVQLQTEFRMQMSNMATREEMKAAIEGLAPKCRDMTIAWLQEDGVTVRFPNYHTRGKPYAGRIVDVRKADSEQ